MIGSGLSHTLGDQMVSHKKVLAIASGVVVGGFLFLRFGWDNNAGLSGWEWYQGAALLGGIGLAGVFPEAPLSAAVGLGMGPLLVESVQTYLHLSRDPTCCTLWPVGLAMVFFFGLPAPLIGSGISRLFMRTRLPRTVYFVALTGGLVIGAGLPNIQNAERQRIETETVPGLLKQIYDAEMIYRARQPNGNFACEGTLLPGAVGKLRWSHITGSTINQYLFVQHYTISLDCPNNNPRTFQVSAFSHDIHVRAPSFIMDETGKVTRSPPAAPAAPRAPSPSRPQKPDSQPDVVRILSISPKPGATVPRGQPHVFHVDILYRLVSADSAFLVISVAQVRKSSAECSRVGGELTDAAKIPIVRGERTLKLDVTWSGDTGQATRGRVLGRGFVSFAPSIWENHNGLSGRRLKSFGIDPEYCYPFGP